MPAPLHLRLGPFAGPGKIWQLRPWRAFTYSKVYRTKGQLAGGTRRIACFASDAGGPGPILRYACLGSYAGWNCVVRLIGWPGHRVPNARPKQLVLEGTRRVELKEASVCAVLSARTGRLNGHRYQRRSGCRALPGNLLQGLKVQLSCPSIYDRAGAPDRCLPTALSIRAFRNPSPQCSEMAQAAADGNNRNFSRASSLAVTTYELEEDT